MRSLQKQMEAWEANKAKIQERINDVATILDAAKNDVRSLSHRPPDPFYLCSHGFGKNPKSWEFGLKSGASKHFELKACGEEIATVRDMKGHQRERFDRESGASMGILRNNGVKPLPFFSSLNHFQLIGVQGQSAAPKDLNAAINRSESRRI